MRGSSRCARRSKARSRPASVRSASAPSSSLARRLLRIVNQRAERGRLDDLRRLVNRLEGERAALIARRDDLEKLHADLAAQTQAFMEGRLRPAGGADGRAQERDRRGDRQPRGGRARARARHAAGRLQDHDQRRLREGAARRHRDDRDARRRCAIAWPASRWSSRRCAKGVFIGDSYNDRPRSSQRADEIAQRLSEVVADIRERETQLASLRTEIAEETRRYEELAAAELSAPVRGSVWEVMTAPGETVVRGQELVRLLDCSGVVVTATVGETAYNRLQHRRSGALPPARREHRPQGAHHRAHRRRHGACQPRHPARGARQGALPRDGGAARSRHGGAVRHRPHRPRHLRQMSPTASPAAGNAGARACWSTARRWWCCPGCARATSARAPPWLPSSSC